MHHMPAMGKVVHNVRTFVAALLVVQFSGQCGSQPLPVLPLNRFGTKNTYNNTLCEQHMSDDDLTLEDMEFCCRPVQVDELSVLAI